MPRLQKFCEKSGLVYPGLLQKNCYVFSPYPILHVVTAACAFKKTCTTRVGIAAMREHLKDCGDDTGQFYYDFRYACTGTWSL